MKRILAVLATLTLTSAMGVALQAAVAPPAGADIACGLRATTLTNFPIADDSTTTSIADLSGITANDPLVDLDVEVNITHSFVDDLVVTLSYGGHTVRLISHRGGDGDNLTGTRFDDGAPSHVSNGAAPFTGRFRPEQSLNAFDGLNPAGSWTLNVTDSSSGDTGTLHNWTLVLRTEWCDDFDRDRIKDPNDLCTDHKGVQPHGCPVRGRTVTIVYRNTPKEFRGKLTCSAAPRCHEGQPVRIYKVRSGNDALVGRGFTTSTGTYAIPKANVGGRYYAVAPEVVEEGVAECSRAQSANLTV
ncbi:proprotein convertase P-domain-containing protein [Nocardioides bizhenqiangii]|uniref:Proprotein convertase P-domain-containing protein n=1 Tax=Nocardioides bizhenqiangii TaxID=3095076 RepID=A0ABZ0ZNA1_9ACTN|nr:MULTISPECIES: proprotein convertase P-domain-containing protein [unclassified Nocardioides]MDZ5621377.1 proprotein convertase P-domain-containing protein [Nocardioides sp. HM23]WQQ25783.1 proprotein convertase P-domain-containing protein [Nocardioides sp. HM61]